MVVRRSYYFLAYTCLGIGLFGCSIKFKAQDLAATANMVTSDSAPLAPSLFTLSDPTIPTATFLAQSSDIDVSYFQCRVDSGSWFTCASPFNITDNGSSIAAGFSGTLSVRAVDSGGNLGAVAQKSFIRGQWPRGLDRTVESIVSLPSGAAFFGGLFQYMNVNVAAGLTRLKSDGSYDSSFIGIKSGFYHRWTEKIYTIVPERDTLGTLTGKLIVGGYFTEFNDQDCPDSLVRLNSDGSLDTSFNPGGTGVSNSSVYTVVQELNTSGVPTGKFLLGGSFSQYNGVSVPRSLIRVNNDGSLDATFNNAGAGFDSGAIVYAITQQLDVATGNPTGKLLIGGSYTTYNAVDVPDFITRLDVNGALDGTFNGGTGFAGTMVRTIVQELNSGTGLPTGNLLIGGLFTQYKGSAAIPINLLRLDIDGNFDATFNSGQSGFNDRVLTILPERNGVGLTGKLLVGGGFSGYNASDVHDGLVRLNSDGSLDGSFTGTGSGFSGYGYVYRIVQERDTNGAFTGNLVVGGDFSTLGATSVTGLARLSSVGLFDSTFNPGGHGVADDLVYEVVQELAVGGLPNGNIIIGGQFNSMNGQDIPNSLVQLKGDGALETTFNPGGIGFGYSDEQYVWDVVREKSTAGAYTGKLLVAGTWYRYNGVSISPNNLVRINSDGSFDSSFNGGGLGAQGGTQPVQVISQELDTLGKPTGKILIGGELTGYNGTDTPDGLIRLNSDGTLDGTFNTGNAGTDSIFATIYEITPQLDASGNPTGKTWIGGRFTSYNSVAVGRMILVDSAGLQDGSFNAGQSGFNGNVYSIVQEIGTNNLPNGKVIAAGDYSTYNGAAAWGVIRLNSGGTRDGAFTVTGCSGGYNVYTLLQERDTSGTPTGKIIIGGVFQAYDGADVPDGLIRLNNDGTYDSTFNSGGIGVIGKVKTLAYELDATEKPTGRILVGGDLRSYNGESVRGVFRINANGSLDPTYHGQQR